MPKRPSEFALIERFFAPLSGVSSFLRCGIGDDCAVLTPAADEELLLSVDTLVEGVHFPPAYPPSQLAERALAVCLSDLAAAGASPRAFTLALTAPSLDEPWLASFSEALAGAAGRYGLALAGGDTTRGPLCLSLQVMGVAPRGAALLRSGARQGDDIYVSGNLGGARAALDFLSIAEPTAFEQRCLQRYHRPEPRVALGEALRGVATAAIDISDGLAADLGHILRASAAGARLYCERLPLLEGLDKLAQGLDYALSGGDDYELCFTAPVAARDQLVELAERLTLPLTRVGEITTGQVLRCIGSDGEPVTPAGGYQHF